MSDFLSHDSKAPGEALLDAAPGSALAQPSPVFRAFSKGSPTPSDTGFASSPQGYFTAYVPQQQQQHRTPASNLTASLTANNSSYSFSFCGSDAFGVHDVTNSEASLSPSPQQQPQPHPLLQDAAQQLFAPSQDNGALYMPSTPVPGQVSNGVGVQPVSLATVNMDGFYGIPTPSAPPRTPYAASTASNGSSSHHQASASGDSVHNQTSSSVTAFSVDPPPQTGVQKDVLAFIAAEQQQQKFVLQQRNVYMSGLPVDFRPSAFRAMCEVFGRIESSKLCMEADDANRCRGFGFVLFYGVDSATSCIASLNGKVMQGKTLQVRRADLSAAPQPLNPVTQRNRTGSGLVTPPSLPQVGSGGVGAAMANAAGSNSHGAPAPGASYPLFSPQPPTTGPNNAIASSMVMSNLPFTFATPTMVGVPPHPNASMLSGSSNATCANNMTPQKGSATNSSFLYNGPSASSSLGTSSNPTMVYAQNATMLPAMRNGVPIMQMFTSGPQPGPANMMPQQQTQQQQQLMSHLSMSRSEAGTSHTATPSSAGSSNMNVTFIPAPQFQPQPPATPGSAVAFYRPNFDGQNAFMASANMSAGSNPHMSTNSGGGGGLMPSYSTSVSNLYAPNVQMQEYLAASGLDPNASNSNIYYFFPQ